MDIFSFVKTRVTILDVVQDYTTLKRAGNYYKGQCPFHHERTASFTVSPHKEIFYCFGCHTGGDSVTFITKIENCSPMEAIKHLAERFDITLPEASIPSSTKKQERELYTLCHETVAHWCAEQLQKSRTAQEYIKKRGVTPASVAHFSIGYFPGGQQSLKNLLRACKEKNILAQDLIAANIIRQTGTQDTLFSPYEERIVFPITDALGRACGLGGRIFKEGDTRAKYYNSQDHPYFSKGSLVYGFALAKKAIQQSGIVYMVEGYLDCIALVQAGLPETIATLGTACTAEHIKMLARYAQKLYTAYDGDAAGQKAALRLTQLCWDVDLEPSIIQLPANEDPCSLVAQGVPVATLAAQAVNIFEYFIAQTAGDSATLSMQERMSRIKEIIEMIRNQQDPIKQAMLLQKAASACAVPYETLKKSLFKLKQVPLYEKISPQPPTPKKLTIEEEIIKYLDVYLEEIPKNQITGVPESEAFCKALFFIKDQKKQQSRKELIIKKLGEIRRIQKTTLIQIIDDHHINEDRQNEYRHGGLNATPVMPPIPILKKRAEPTSRDSKEIEAIFAKHVPTFTQALAQSMNPYIPEITLRQAQGERVGEQVQASPEYKQIEITTLDKKLFSAILTRKYILTPEEHAFLKLAFSPYLLTIVERLQQYKDRLDTITITDLCAEHEREAVVSLLMEDEVQGQGPELQELFLQFYKKRWKTIVNSVKIKIAQAQKLQQNTQVDAIITQFQSLKQKLFMKDQV